MAPQASPVCVWDFTLKLTNEEENAQHILNMVHNHCKKWSYQIEQGETGYVHWQGRVSFKEKLRKEQILRLWPGDFHWTITSRENRDNMFYVTKETGRIKGPWKDTDAPPPYIPRQVRGITLRPWQQYIIDDANVWNTRHINIILDVMGGHGKSTIKTYTRAHQLGRFIPFVNDYKDLMRIVMDCKKEKLYIIDIPRAIQKDKLYQFYAGLETLKDGYAYDDRYHFKDECFDCPNIWVFTNRLPDPSLLSRDRWRIWTIEEDHLQETDFSGASL